MSEPLYCTGCGREWGIGSCNCGENDPEDKPFPDGRFCHLCGCEHESDSTICDVCDRMLRSRE